MKVLVLGSSGYIGSHLIGSLLAAKHSVTAASRNIEVIQDRNWSNVQIVYCDLFDVESIHAALRDIDVAFYLVHSMAAGDQFDSLDRTAAENFKIAADASSLKQIIYLGGLQPLGTASKHLSSRKETGDILRQSTIPVTELRAGIVVGAGSAGFEMIRDLVYHLRFMITPKWVRSMTQPIALDDLLQYLVRIVGLKEVYNNIYDVAGTSTIKYQDMLKQFANSVDRMLLILPVPFISPKLSSYWLDLVTAVPKQIAKPLINGLRNDLIGDTKPIEKIITIPLMSYTEAIKSALDTEKNNIAASRWTESSIFFRQYKPENSFFSKEYQVKVITDIPAKKIWQVIISVGGNNGWYYLTWIWKIRGFLDRLFGGIGMRRGRRHPTEIRIGDSIDFFRAGGIDPVKRLTLLAEMKVPGSAILEFEIRNTNNKNEFITTARYHPSGTIGLLYWYILLPVHGVLFKGMVKKMLEKAKKIEDNNI